MMEYISNEIIQPFSEIPLPLLLLIVVTLMIQSTWLFTDARKYNKYPWFWGIWGLIQFPMPLLCYLIFVKKIYKRKKEDKS